MSETLYQGRYFAIVAHQTHGEFVRADDEVLIVPLTIEGDVLLAVEPSASFEGTTWILPGGQPEPPESHPETANRELQEEIGYRARQLDFLGELRPFSKYLTTRSFVYLARELEERSLSGDESYAIGIERVSLARFERAISSGQLLDARVIAALFLARQFLKGPD